MVSHDLYQRLAGDGKMGMVGLGVSSLSAFSYVARLTGIVSLKSSRAMPPLDRFKVRI